MTITPLELLDTSIAQLQTLVAFLDDQLDTKECATAEACACQEIARSLCRLIRTYQAERPADGRLQVRAGSVASTEDPSSPPASSCADVGRFVIMR